MAETRTLDDEFVGTLVAPEKALIVWDEELSGFGVRVLPSGRRSWIVGFRAMGPGGKEGSRRRVIGIHGEMQILEARRKAREVLAEVASEEEPDGRQKEQAAGAAAEPVRAAEAPPNDAAVEEAPGAGARAETASGYLASTGEEIEPETGEVFSAGEGEWDDPDEGLEIENVGQGPDAGRLPEAVSGEEADDDLAASALAGVLDGVTGSGAGDGYQGVAEAGRRAERSGMPRVEARSGAAPAEGGDAQAEGDAAGGYPDSDDEHGGERRRGERREVADEGKTAGRGPSWTGRARSRAADIGNRVVEGGRALMSKKGEGSVVEEEPMKAARDEPESGPSAGGNAEAAGADVPEGSGEPTLDARTKRTSGAEEKAGGGKRLSEESVASLARNLDGIRGVVDRIEALSAKMGPQIEMLSGSAAVIAGDRRLGRRCRAWAALAMAAMLVLGTVGGAAVQSRIEVLPQADPSLGWKDHVWNHYGEAFMGCFQRARQTETGRAECAMEVRAR